MKGNILKKRGLSPNPTVTWSRGAIKLIDQTKLPAKLEYLYCRDVPTLVSAIKRLSVRGAPAIGVAAGLGLRLAAAQYKGKTVFGLVKHLEKTARRLAASRPTAVNLFNVLEDVVSFAGLYVGDSVNELKMLIHKRVQEIYEEDRLVCRAMGDHGARLVKNGMNLLTVCNAGALATVDYGTALGVMYSAKANRKKFKVYACETRPLLQGARLTTWELLRAKIDTTLICDNMAATLMQQGRIDLIFTGADRIAANGDTANKIGTYNLAVLAKYHGVPFYVVAPQTTFDLTIKTGAQIPIEQRRADEVTSFGLRRTAPQNIKVYNPAFDVTGAKLISGIVTEKGIIYPPFKSNIKKVFS